MENIIIGLLNIPKILACKGVKNKRETAGSLIFISVFFSIHYGMFCLGHYIFLKQTYKDLPGVENFLSSLLSPMLAFSILGLFLSHLISMGVNFYGKKEYLDRRPNTQMFMPYSRIVLLHVVIVFSGLFAIALGQGLATLLLLVVVKIIFDLAAHIVEHSKSESLIAPSPH